MDKFIKELGTSKEKMEDSDHYKRPKKPDEYEIEVTADYD